MFNILISKYVLHYNDIYFFQYRFSKIPNNLRNAIIRDFPTFSRIYIFILLTLLFSNFSLLSASSLLRVRIIFRSSNVVSFRSFRFASPH